VRRLSILIPYWGRLTSLEETLVSVLQNRPEACEVVVVLNHPYADPYHLDGEVAFVAAEPELGLLGSVARGLALCRAPVIHLLRCGMEVAPHWVESVLPHFEDEDVAAVAPLIARRDAPSRLVSAGVEYRAAGRIQRLAAGQTATVGLGDKRPPSSPDSLAGFYRREVLTRIVELADREPADFGPDDLIAALGVLDVQCRLEPRCRTYASAELLAVDRSLRAGRAAERVFWRWAPQHPGIATLLGHLGLFAEEAAQSIVRPTTLLQLTGRAVGTLQLGRIRRQRAVVDAWRSAQAGESPRIMHIDDHRRPSTLSPERRCA
jgi:hypothetical protein